MKNRLLLKPLFIFSIPVLILVLLVIPPTWTTLTGEEIKIQTAPVDPTDLFRGSYVDLEYEIESVTPSTLDDSIISDFKSKHMGDYKKVYVALKQGKDGLYHVDFVTKKKPGTGIYLKGNLQIPYELKSASTIHVNYGLDNYYAPKEKAIEMENAASAKPSVAVVKIKNGNAVLKEIVID